MLYHGVDRRGDGKVALLRAPAKRSLHRAALFGDEWRQSFHEFVVVSLHLVLEFPLDIPAASFRGVDFSGDQLFVLLQRFFATSGEFLEGETQSSVMHGGGDFAASDGGQEHRRDLQRTLIHRSADATLI